MKITDIYDRYDIMPNLREHQLRVAAVAKYICDHLPEKDFSERDLVSACLLHDMGNIIKADLTLFPEFMTPDILPHWEDVQRSMRAKYKDEHEATLAIAKELCVKDAILEYLENARFSKFNEIETDIAVKIYNYADMRVDPYGVVSLQERLGDLRRRYDEKNRVFSAGSKAFNREGFEKRIFEFEKDIFALVAIAPLYITNETVAPIIEELRNFDIETLAS